MIAVPGTKLDLYEVTLEPSGKQIQVKEGQTLLDGIIRNGLQVSYGCRHGNCALCKAKVLDGEYEIMDRVTDYSLLSFERDEGYVLLCSTVPESDLIVEIEEEESEGLEFHPVLDFEATIVNNERLTKDIHLIQVEMRQQNGIRYSSGQFFEFDIPEIEQTRAYSMANRYVEKQPLDFHVKRIENGAGSNYMCDLQPGATVTGSGPYGKMQLINREKDLIFIAGGSGMAPIKALVEELFNGQYQHQAWFFYGARTKDDLFLTEQWTRLEKDYPNFHFVPALSDQPNDEEWLGETGYIANVVEKYLSDVSQMDAYLCGPPILIETVTNTLYKGGLRRSNIFSDEF
jgi:NAD(P)H-flavin reductase/ferredoxin